MTKSMSRALQGILSAFHLQLPDSHILQLGREAYHETDNEWSDTHQLFVDGYMQARSEDTEKVEDNQW